MGAIIKTIGNAMSHDGSQAPTQWLKNPSTSPVLWKLEMPDTSKDIRDERMKPNRIGPNREGIMRKLLDCDFNADRPLSDLTEGALFALNPCV
jgi:hypothetical protein